MPTLKNGMRSRARYAAVALANTPDNVRVVRICTSLSGFACINPKHSDFGMLCAPRPVTRKALYIYLHECAHFVLHADRKRRGSYVEEMEAEQWAHKKMREAGIAVPRMMTRDAKYQIAVLMIRACNEYTWNSVFHTRSL